jgi:hypothetical protein
MSVDHVCRHIISQHLHTKKSDTSFVSPRTSHLVHCKLAKVEQFLLLIRYSSCYSYIQSSPINVLGGLEEGNIYVKSKTSSYKKKWYLFCFPQNISPCALQASIERMINKRSMCFARKRFKLYNLWIFYVLPDFQKYFSLIQINLYTVICFSFKG